MKIQTIFVVFLYSLVADKLWPSGRNLVDLGGGRRTSLVTRKNYLAGDRWCEGWKISLVWHEGEDGSYQRPELGKKGQMINKYPAEKYCGSLLPQSQLFEGLHFDIKIYLGHMMHLSGTNAFFQVLQRLELMERFRTWCISAIDGTSVLWHLRTTSAPLGGISWFFSLFPA